MPSDGKAAGVDRVGENQDGCFGDYATGCIAHAPQPAVLADLRHLTAKMQANRCPATGNVGPAERRRIDPTGTRKPPAAERHRPAGQVAGFLAVDEAQNVRRRLPGLDDTLLRSDVRRIAPQVQNAARRPTQGEILGRQPGKMLQCESKSGVRQPTQAIVVERRQWTHDADQVA